MGAFEVSLFIDRQPEVIFDFMSIPENDLLWQKNLISSEWTSPEPHGAGATKRVISRFMGREMEATAEYTVWDRPNVYGFKAVNGPLSVVGSTRFEPKGNGTQITIVGQVEATGVFKLLEGLAIRQARKQDITNFKALKALLEAG